MRSSLSCANQSSPCFVIQHARRRLGRVALRVRAARDQLDLAGSVEARLAGEQAAVVGRPRAQAAEVLHVGAVVVGVEAADQALPRRHDLADAAAHLDALALDRLALRVEGDDAELGAAAVARPAARLDAEDERARPELDPRRRGLGLAVRVVERHLGVDLRRPRRLRQVLQREAGDAVAVGRQRHLVGDQLAVAAVARRARCRRSRALPTRPASDRAPARS